MSYQFYKIMHIVSLIVLTSTIGIGFLGTVPRKWTRILGMSASFLLMVAGMGLLARVYPQQPWPLWVKLKLIIWGIVATFVPFTTKRLKNYRTHAFILSMCLLILAVFFAILTPFQ